MTSKNYLRRDNNLDVFGCVQWSNKEIYMGSKIIVVIGASKKQMELRTGTCPGHDCLEQSMEVSAAAKSKA